MRKTLGIALAVALGIGLYALAAGVPDVLGHGPGGGFGWRGGYGMMGPGMGMMGPGMMGPGMMGPGWGGPGPGFQRGFGPGFGPTLTPEQQTKLETIYTKAREKAAPLYARLGTLQVELRNLLAAPQVDEAAVKAKYAEIAKVREQLITIRAETQTEVAKVLTPEQRQQIGGPGSFQCPGFGGGPIGGRFGFGPHRGWGY